MVSVEDGKENIGYCEEAQLRSAKTTEQVDRLAEKIRRVSLCMLEQKTAAVSEETVEESEEAALAPDDHVKDERRTIVEDSDNRWPGAPKSPLEIEAASELTATSSVLHGNQELKTRSGTTFTTDSGFASATSTHVTTPIGNSNFAYGDNFKIPFSSSVTRAVSSTSFTPSTVKGSVVDELKVGNLKCYPSSILKFDGKLEKGGTVICSAKATTSAKKFFGDESVSDSFFAAVGTQIEIPKDGKVGNSFSATSMKTGIESVGCATDLSVSDSFLLAVETQPKPQVNQSVQVHGRRVSQIPVLCGNSRKPSEAKLLRRSSLNSSLKSSYDSPSTVDRSGDLFDVSTSSPANVIPIPDVPVKRVHPKHSVLSPSTPTGRSPALKHFKCSSPFNQGSCGNNEVTKGFSSASTSGFFIPLPAEIIDVCR